MRTALAAALALAACARAPEPRDEGRRQTLEGLTLSQSEGGSPAWTLRSRLAELREDENEAGLESPVMDFYRGGRAVSRVTARSGSVRTDTRDVRLSSAVVLESFEDKSRLTTDELLYTAASGRLHTDSGVEIRRPEGVIRGEGMEASPDLTEIRIHRQRSVLTGRPR